MLEMNILARELNQKLAGTVVHNLLSVFGKNIYFPKGIVAQSMEAKIHAKKYNATVGMAYNNGKPMHLTAIRQCLPALEVEEIFPYAPTAGDPELRELWKEQILKKNPDLNGKNISLPVLTPALTNGLVTVADLFVDTGDIIVMPDIFWGNYRLIFEVRKQARVLTFPFFRKDGMNIDAMVQALQNGLHKGKIILLLNFPNNPTGYSPTKREAEEIVQALLKLACSGQKIIVITDDSYFGLFYEEEIYKQSLFAPLAWLHENIMAIKADGCTKEDFVWGFRIGFLTYGCKGLEQDQYEALIKKTMGALRCSISNSNRLGQSLLKRAFKSKTYETEKKAAFNQLEKRYRKVKDFLAKNKSKFLKPLPFNSGYFMSLACRGIDAEALRKYLLLERGIGTIAIDNQYLRIAYASVELDQIEDLFTEIFQAADLLAAKKV
jgi:aspartate/methionine/tyrosine aminotransferase